VRMNGVCNICFGLKSSLGLTCRWVLILGVELLLDVPIGSLVHLLDYLGWLVMPIYVVVRRQLAQPIILEIACKLRGNRSLLLFQR